VPFFNIFVDAGTEGNVTGVDTGSLMENQKWPKKRIESNLSFLTYSIEHPHVHPTGNVDVYQNFTSYSPCE